MNAAANEIILNPPATVAAATAEPAKLAVEIGRAHV